MFRANSFVHSREKDKVLVPLDTLVVLKRIRAPRRDCRSKKGHQGGENTGGASLVGSNRGFRLRRPLSSGSQSSVVAVLAGRAVSGLHLQ